MNKVIIICMTIIFCFIVVAAFISDKHKSEVEKEYALMGLEQCKASAWETNYIWVKNCSEYIRARNGDIK